MGVTLTGVAEAEFDQYKIGITSQIVHRLPHHHDTTLLP